MKISKFLIYLSIAILTILIVYRINNNKSKYKSSSVGASKTASNVRGIVLIPQKFSNQLSLSGTIEANEQVELRSETAGVVQGIYFTEGSFVKKGQLLIKVNDADLKAQLSQSKTHSGLAEENERRAKLLLQKEAISQEEYDISLAELKSRQAQVHLIEAQIAKTSIVAPFSGKIGLRYISPGTYVSPTTPIAKLVNSQQVKISFSIPEKYASLMKTGAEISFMVSGSKETFKATIYAVEPEVDISTRTLQLRAVAENQENKLIPGTFANIILPLEDVEDALLVPNEAIVPIQNGKKVFISENNLAKEVIVETSVRTDKDILVTSGLKPGDTVITSGIMSLRNGSLLKINLPQN
ncbi:MAG TPA: efflux RND transporter periplasmic adaptor subunit [Flavobacterium sp.]|nr:efflux RND transporter periplasmic adaptor subunit [Flavobacterium sp.]